MNECHQNSAEYCWHSKLSLKLHLGNGMIESIEYVPRVSRNGLEESSTYGL